jgi:hypothetical protein
VPHITPEDPQTPAPRAESLARIAAITALLRSYDVSPPDAFVWSYQEMSTWWAFGRFGRYTVATPRRFGWAVGELPWEGPVRDRDGLSNEVFVKPTFVDAAGRIAPLDATRASPADNHLLTDEICQNIADQLELIAAESVRAETDGDADPDQDPDPRAADLT